MRNKSESEEIMTSVTNRKLTAQEVHFEESILRNPYNIKLWWGYLEHLEGAKPSTKYIIFERALSFLPRSYKLWYAYLQERAYHTENRSVTDQSYTALINTFERSLVQMHKMPRIWVDYCKLLITLKKGTQARKTFDRALQALPVTQHKPIWTIYLEWVKSFGVEETAVRVFRRYLMYNSAAREDFVSYLEEIGQFEEAARQLSIVLNDEHFVSSSGQTHHQLWMRLCHICAQHPQAVINTINVEDLVRSGIAKFSDEVGRLWNSLADYYIRLGQFEKARDVYEEAVTSVSTVRDFAIVFDAYVKVEETILTAKMRLLEEEQVGHDWKTGDSTMNSGVKIQGEIDMRLARLEYLIDKRPTLLNSVVLRQNPHNVHEWHKRVKLFKDDPQQIKRVFTEAIETIDPKSAYGRLSGLWLAFAQTVEQDNDIEGSRDVLARATKVNFKSVDELANVWCAWAEMEMRHNNYEKALTVMTQAVTEPVESAAKRRAKLGAQGTAHGSSVAVDDDSFEGALTADRLYKNVKVWSLYLDLEESLGSVESCRAAYDRVFELKVVTAQMGLNYAAFLEEHNFFEDSFTVYERAVNLFEFPQVKPIWLLYLDKFMARYGGTKLERLRDLFEQSVAKVPEGDAAEFYIKYSKAEEEYGLARHAMAVLGRATKRVAAEHRLNMYRLYSRKVEQLFGATKTRPIFESAIRDLDDTTCKALCVDFADMEQRMGEIDRARAVLQYGSQFADPRRDPSYWHHWRSFEESHGNEDTFREMLRVQRSVETSFAQVNYLAAELLAGEGIDNRSAQSKTSSSFVSAAPRSVSSSSATAASTATSLDANDIDAMSQLEERNLATSAAAALTRKRPAAEKCNSEGSPNDSNEYAHAHKRSNIAVNDEEIDI